MLYAIGGAVLGVLALVLLVIRRIKRGKAGLPVFHILKDKPGGSHWYVGLAFLMIMFGCNTPCSESVIVVPAANYLTTQWACVDLQGNPNVKCMTNLLGGIASKIGVCTQATAMMKNGKSAGPIASLMCPLVIGELKNLLVKNSSPVQQCGCDPSKVGALIAGGVSAICSAIVPL